MAAALDLQINLGHAYIIPYKDKKRGITVATFQMGYKGYIQLAIRSGQIKNISATEVYAGQQKERDPLKGYTFDWNAKSTKIIGYAAYISLINGFEKTIYKTNEQIVAHAKKYSKTYGDKYGIWETEFNEMAKKTMIKELISKYAPLSIEMTRALIVDQEINDLTDGVDDEYAEVQADVIPIETGKDDEREVV